MWGDKLRVVLQRVSEARVLLDDQVVGRIGKGLVLLLGVRVGDTEDDVRWLAEKCLHIRVFENAQGKFDTSLIDVDGEILVVSQFTVYGDCRRGRRPSFTDAAPPDIARSLYESFVQTLKQSNVHVETGVFAEHMCVELCNQGPVTLIIDSNKSALE